MKKQRNQLNSVINLTAQTTKLCETGNETGTSISSAVINFYKSPEISNQDKALVELLFLSGCRISEILSISHRNITKDGRILVLGSKGSNNKIINPSIFKEYFLNCKKFNYDPFNQRNRFYYYRLFKKKGLILFHQGNEKNSVTHSLRYNLVSDLQNTGFDSRVIKQFIGHKNIKSTEHYVNKTKK
jgi:site-specific recombinase XerD